MEKETHFSSTYYIPGCIRDFMYLSNLILILLQSGNRRPGSERTAHRYTALGVGQEGSCP